MKGTMKESIHRDLVCRRTRGPRTLEVLAREGGEIIEGYFENDVGARHPIIGGVPRLLRHYMLAEIPRDYPELFRRHGKHFQLIGRAAAAVSRSSTPWRCDRRLCRPGSAQRASPSKIGATSCSPSLRRSLQTACSSCSAAPRLRVALGREGRGRVERQFSWDHIGGKLADLYQGIVDARERA